MKDVKNAKRDKGPKPAQGDAPHKAAPIGAHPASGGQTFTTVETPGGVTNPMDREQPNPVMEEQTERPAAA